MAVIHVTEEEAAREFASLLNKVESGTEVRIARGDATIAVLRPPASAKPKTLSEAIMHAKARNSQVLLDDQWSTDLEAVIRQHETDFLTDPWE